MVNSDNTVPGGIYIQNIEQRLKSSLVQIAKDNTKPWKAVSMGMAPMANAMLPWASGHLAEITYQQLLDSGVFAEPPVVLLCGDQSAIIFYQLHEKADAAGFRQHVEHILFESAGVRLWQEFNLPQQLNDFLKVCQKHLKNDAQSFSMETSAPYKLDVTAFSKPAFLQALHSPRKPGKFRILVVEDDPVTGKLLVQLLKNYDVKLAASAQHAVEAYVSFLPDLVLLDVGLPYINGLDFLEILHKYNPKAAVVMLTADSKRETLEKAVASGAVGFIAKPFTFQKILYYIEKIESK